MEKDNGILAGLLVAVVDDHEVVLEGLRSFLLKNGVGCVEVYRRAAELLRSVGSQHYDLFIIDIELLDSDAATLIDNIRERQPDAKFVVNTMHEEMWVVNKMAEKKVDGVVYKDAQLSQLLEAVEAVAEGRQFYCRKYRKSLELSRLQRDVLTRRETEVVQAIAAGLSTKEIAQQLFISENTVESHRQNIAEKLGSHGVADMIIKAIAAGYINPDLMKKVR